MRFASAALALPDRPSSLSRSKSRLLYLRETHSAATLEGYFHVEAEVVEGEGQSSFSYAVPDDGEVSFLCISAL